MRGASCMDLSRSSRPVRLHIGRYARKIAANLPRIWIGYGRREGCSALHFFRADFAIFRTDSPIKGLIRQIKADGSEFGSKFGPDWGRFSPKLISTGFVLHEHAVAPLAPVPQEQECMVKHVGA